MTETLRARQVIILLSYEYVNLTAVHSHLSSLLPAQLHIASKDGLGRTILKSGLYPSAQPLKWTPTYSPTMPTDLHFDSALLFWDGSDPLLRPSIDFFQKHSIPLRIIGPDAKPVALAKFYATFQNGDSKMSAQPQVQVIVDAPKQPETYGHATKDSKVRVQLHLPESVVNKYETQAQSVKQPVEKVMSDRLRTCVTHTSGRGLYLNDDQRSSLERMTGGHLIMDADMALQKIHTTVSLKVGDITIELTERVLARCASRAKAERKSFEDFVKKEVIQGLERSTGLRPW
jgi:hypothetical protein